MKVGPPHQLSRATTNERGAANLNDIKEYVGEFVEREERGEYNYVTISKIKKGKVNHF